jgi:hypothetical protein
MGKTKRNLPTERYWKNPKHKQRQIEGNKSEKFCQYDEQPVAAFKEVYGGLQKNYFDKKRYV